MKGTQKGTVLKKTRVKGNKGSNTAITKMKLDRKEENKTKQSPQEELISLSQATEGAATKAAQDGLKMR